MNPFAMFIVVIVNVYVFTVTMCILGVNVIVSIKVI
jgi:hypothetical protein